jgi:hypothetical protein
MRKIAVIACLALSALLAASAVAAPRVYYRLPLNDRPVVKPKRIEFKDLTLSKISWTGWGGRTATGTANASSLSCDPSCAEGRRYRGTATLRMFKRHREGERRFYGCMTGRVRAGKASGRVEWPPGCASQR